ncbi:hypothetical protein Hanom_Chr15g01404161 [Helianthus anomalus]
MLNLSLSSSPSTRFLSISPLNPDCRRKEGVSVVVCNEHWIEVKCRRRRSRGWCLSAEI